jgi:3-deoxy-D-manno-octulosonic-acid transferase
MARIPFDKRKLAGFAGRLGGRFIRFVHRTSKLATDLDDAQDRMRTNHPCIITFWHGQFMLIPGFCPRDIPVRIMVARHGDGELIGEALKKFDMELIRGAGAGGRGGDRGGAQAFREAIHALENGYSVPMTSDVPPGPARKAGMGIVKLAQLSGRPILPVAAASSRYYCMDTWSRMTINLPFSRIGIAVGEPIRVAADADTREMETARKAVEDSLNRLTSEAYAIVGADPSRTTPHAALPPDAPPHRHGLKLATYGFLTKLAFPFVPWLLERRKRQGKEDPERVRERLGHPDISRPDGPLVWVHAASVGETNAVLPVIERIRQKRPDLQMLLTTGTRTSARVANERLPEGCIHQFAPWDLMPAVRRFLDHWQPSLMVLTESEIWPNTILEAHRRGIPIALVNARMSSRSQKRWRNHKSLARPLFSRIRLVLAQTERLTRAFRELGARDARPTGNLKIDSPPLPVDDDALRALRETLGARPVWIAASTHSGEDESVIAAHKVIARQIPDLLTIIAPRHPERGAAIAKLTTAAGLETARRSMGALPTGDTAIYVADTIGELGTFYTLAPAALIGGSLIEHGGQNPIEAVRFNTAVITGPHHRNFAQEYETLLKRRGAIVVNSADDLAEAVKTLLSGDVELARSRQAANDALDQLSGALDKTVAALLELVPTKDGNLKRAS